MSSNTEKSLQIIAEVAIKEMIHASGVAVDGDASRIRVPMLAVVRSRPAAAGRASENYSA